MTRFSPCLLAAFTLACTVDPPSSADESESEKETSIWRADSIQDAETPPDIDAQLESSVDLFANVDTGPRVDTGDETWLIFRDTFESGEDGAPVTGANGWICPFSNPPCVSVFTREETLSSDLALATRGGDSEVGRIHGEFAEDFSIDLNFLDGGFGDLFRVHLGDEHLESVLSVGWMAGCSAEDYCLAFSQGESTVIQKRSMGWHTLSIAAAYSDSGAWGVLRVCVDAVCVRDEFPKALGSFWFEDCGSFAFVDDLRIYAF